MSRTLKYIRKRRIKERIAKREMQNELKCERADYCLNCANIPRVMSKRICAECDEGDNWLVL